MYPLWITFRAGGRTGLTSVVTACCFLPCFFIAPLAAAVPGYATSAVLILVGILEERQGATIAEGEEGVAVFAASGRRFLRPRGHQGYAQNVLVKVTRGFLVARHPGGVMQPPRSAHMLSNC